MEGKNGGGGEGGCILPDFFRRTVQAVRGRRGGGRGRNEMGVRYTAGKHRLVDDGWDDIPPRYRGRRDWSRTTAVVDWICAWMSREGSWMGVC
jgi:hypothetical protein